MTLSPRRHPQLVIADSRDEIHERQALVAAVSSVLPYIHTSKVLH